MQMQLIAPWDGRIVVAAKNGPLSSVVSGESAALDAADRAVRSSTKLRARRIDVDYASHSPAVEKLKEQLLARPERHPAAKGKHPDALNGHRRAAHGRRADA